MNERKLNLRDLSQVVEITKSSGYGKSWNESQLAEHLSRGESLALFDEAQLICFVLYQVGLDSWEILWLATHPDFRQKSWMKQLLERFFVAARNCSEVWLEVSQGNQAAAQLYRSLGFVQVGTRPRYYSTGQDAHLYSKKL